MNAECRHESCLALFERLSEYIDGELDEAASGAIESHFETCLACRVCLQTLQRTVEICRSEKPPKVPPSLSRRLRKTWEGLGGPHGSTTPRTG
jgi:anti-sigma factor RsiW